MKGLIKRLSIFLVFTALILGGIQGAQALDTVVVGQPYYYGYPGYGPYWNYGPYVAPYWRGGPVGPYGYGYYNYNPNPALQGGGFVSSPYFLGRQIQRSTGINTGPALRNSGFIFYAPTPGGNGAFVY